MVEQSIRNAIAMPWADTFPFSESVLPFITKNSQHLPKIRVSVFSKSPLHTGTVEKNVCCHISHLCAKIPKSPHKTAKNRILPASEGNAACHNSRVHTAVRRREQERCRPASQPTHQPDKKCVTIDDAKPLPKAGHPCEVLCHDVTLLTQKRKCKENKIGHCSWHIKQKKKRKRMSPKMTHNRCQSKSCTKNVCHEVTFLT